MPSCCWAVAHKLCRPEGKLHLGTVEKDVTQSMLPVFPCPRSQGLSIVWISIWKWMTKHFCFFPGVGVCSYTHVCVWRPQVILGYIHSILSTLFCLLWRVFNWPWTCQVGEHPGSTHLCFFYANVTRLCPCTWNFHSSGGGLRSSSTLPAEPTLQPRSLFFLSHIIYQVKRVELSSQSRVLTLLLCPKWQLLDCVSPRTIKTLQELSLNGFVNTTAEFWLQKRRGWIFAWAFLFSCFREGEHVASWLPTHLQNVSALGSLPEIGRGWGFVSLANIRGHCGARCEPHALGLPWTLHLPPRLHWEAS